MRYLKQTSSVCLKPQSKNQRVGTSISGCWDIHGYWLKRIDTGMGARMSPTNVFALCRNDRAWQQKKLYSEQLDGPDGASTAIPVLPVSWLSDDRYTSIETEKGTRTVTARSGHMIDGGQVNSTVEFLTVFD